MKHNFMQDQVVEHFESAAEIYSSRKGVFDKTDIDLISFFKSAQIKPEKILEVGGGSGYLLDQLGKEAEDVQLINCEISYSTYKLQVNSEINLIGGNAINLPFKTNSFEYIIAKNLLHHIVGTTRKKSKNFAKMAAAEMTRVLNKNGYMMIVEEYHEYSFFAGLIFYLSLLFSLGKISLKHFDIRPKVIVSFLTPNEIHNLFTQKDMVINQVEFEKKYPNKYVNLLLMRLTPFVFDLGFLVQIRRIRKSSSS
jgi:ubiquinone/menaquinone biosynthesis C-methylase UbiE